MQLNLFGTGIADTLIAVAKIVVALVFGAAIGWERERHEKAAGLRTHMLVSGGACLFAVVGMRIQTAVPDTDLLRVVQGALMGTGFLAGGVIFREGASVYGLTTAAGLWMLAAIGLAVGLGEIILALAATVLSFITISLLGRVEPRTRSRGK